MAKRPTLVGFRQETADSADLIISKNGETMIVPLSFEQVRLIAVKATDAACRWPVKPAKAS